MNAGKAIRIKEIFKNLREILEVEQFVLISVDKCKYNK